VLLECDHIKPRAEGGTTDIDNLVTACFECNRGKGAVSLSLVPQSFKNKAIEVAEREAQIKAYYEILEAKRLRKDAELWTIAEMFMSRFGDKDILRSRLTSIRMFLGRLNYFEVLEAMEIANEYCANRGRDRTFRYFCGICWNKINRNEGSDGAD
jgi:hypothetical protein